MSCPQSAEEDDMRDSFIIREGLLHEVHSGRNSPGSLDAKEVRRQFQSLRLPSGAPVLISLPNGIPFLLVFEAILSADLVPMPVSPATPLPRLRAMIDDFGVKAVVSSHWSSRSAEALDVVPFSSFSEFGVAKVARPMPHSTAPGEVILLTSGTSSEFSSGCVHGIAALRRNAARHADAIGLNAGDKMLLVLPLHYSFGLVAQAMAAIGAGTELYIASPPFSAANFLRVLQDNRIDVSSVTPVILDRIHSDVGTHMETSLRVLTVGGDTLGSARAERLVAGNPGIEIYFTYGLTEAGPRVATLAAHRAESRDLTSLGYPLAGTEIRLLSAQTDEPSTGELLVHSDTLLRSKIGRNAVDPRVELDGKQWLRTGDLFHRDERGHLFFTGRRSDFVISNGEKINLGAIKNFCRSIPGVISATTRKTTSPDESATYGLEITVDQDLAAQNRLDTIRHDIMGSLRLHERPQSLTITGINTATATVYK